MSLGDALCDRLLLLLFGFERSDELLDVAPSFDATELLLGFDDGSADPTNNHRSALPTLHVSRVRDDSAVEILDRICGAELLVEKAAETQPLKRERVVEPLFDGDAAAPG